MTTRRRVATPAVAALCMLLAHWVADAATLPVPEVGTAAPAFHLEDQAGNWHDLGEYRGKWVVLYFYPKDETPGCTTQACEFRDNIFAFNKLGAVILGVSVDDMASHKQFAEEHGLPFTLLADPTKQTARAYGVLHSVLGILEIARRTTFIIDPSGMIAKYYPEVDPKGHSQAVLADLTALEASRH